LFKDLHECTDLKLLRSKWLHCGVVPLQYTPENQMRTGIGAMNVSSKRNKDENIMPHQLFFARKGGTGRGCIMLNFNSLLLFSETPKKLVDFYREVLNLEPKWQEEEYTGFQAGACVLIIGPHSKVQGESRNPERIMFNFETNDVNGEFKRMKGLGAKVIAEPYSMGEDPNFLIATLADPDGNYFQLVSPMKE
jgi:predicted enzyme related to lactoylglutathione lyase